MVGRQGFVLTRSRLVSQMIELILSLHRLGSACLNPVKMLFLNFEISSFQQELPLTAYRVKGIFWSTAATNRTVGNLGS